MSATRITKRVTTPLLGIEGGSKSEEYEIAALSSVELKEDAKGSVRVESVKVYANNPEEAGLIATKIMFETRARISEIQDAKMRESLHASVSIKQ